MRLHTVESIIAAMMSLILALSGIAGVVSGAVPVIGTVVAKGTFRVDNATVTGNATLFEGAMIETGVAASRMELATGARVSLGTDSKARFFGDHMILEKGEGRLEKAESFRFEARGLTIQPETGNATARVALTGGAHVELAALSGSFRVLNSQGLLVANLASGHALELEPQTTESTSKVTGTLRQVGLHYLLKDETTNVMVELAGPGLVKEVGSRVEVTGQMDPSTTPVTDAAHFIRVTAVKHLGKGVPEKSGTAPAASATTATSHGIALSATTIAIIGGVAVAATLGGLAAAGKLTGQGSSSVSR